MLVRDSSWVKKKKASLIERLKTHRNDELIYVIQDLNGSAFVFNLFGETRKRIWRPWKPQPEKGHLKGRNTQNSGFNQRNLAQSSAVCDRIGLVGMKLLLCAFRFQNVPCLTFCAFQELTLTEFSEKDFLKWLWYINPDVTCWQVVLIYVNLRSLILIIYLAGSYLMTAQYSMLFIYYPIYLFDPQVTAYIYSKTFICGSRPLVERLWCDCELIRMTFKCIVCFHFLFTKHTNDWQICEL